MKNTALSTKDNARFGSDVQMKTPIEIALGVDENGMTTAKKLYDFLELDSRNYSRWCRTNITENEFATENEDYEVFFTNDENPLGGRPTQDFKLTSKFARKLSMTQKNHRGEEARDYFTGLEDRAKQLVIDRSQLSLQTQALMSLIEGQARQELEQKRQAEQINRIEQKQEAIADTFQKVDDTEDFQKWANDKIARIAESSKFDKGYGRSKNYSLARAESYERLKQKRNCRLDDRVQKAIGRALEERPDIKKSELQKINKLYIIANDKDLRPAYELVIKEMMIYYCVS
ncbi:MAG TPA: antA/AntB antirepressor family protein [Candidatus Acetatifactor stercoripullorum]|uniref:AntA/AntB antirepressor family protein n=1 Tax=Candidatus Acetatifactor stercoripullorum TaxID=2838414 RepID=A0A9D1UCW3_9FIRM|nr:antA/AntB antirepressor family protein [Candidatus Acetatifactor stercoripullorum]